MRALSSHVIEATLQPVGSARTLITTDQGGVFALDTASGCTVTLPASVGDGGRYLFIVTTVATSNSHIIKVANTNDVIQGIVINTGTAGALAGYITNATSDTITLNRTTTGSVSKGEWFEVWDAASGTFVVRGFASNTGTGATPFSATV